MELEEVLRENAKRMVLVVRNDDEKVKVLSSEKKNINNMVKHKKDLEEAIERINKEIENMRAKRKQKEGGKDGK